MTDPGRKPVVMRSIEDATGDRCVDILCKAPNEWAFSECRRDPEDAHGWRALSATPHGWWDSEAAALAAARDAVGWLDEPGTGT